LDSGRNPWECCDLSTDLNIGTGFWWKSNHKDDNHEFIGGNALYNDGSVSWSEGTQMILRQSHAGQHFFF